MKVIINIDNDQIIGLTAFSGEGKEAVALIKDYCAEHDSIEVNPSLLGEEAKQLQIAMAAMVIGQIGENLGKK